MLLTPSSSSVFLGYSVYRREAPAIPQIYDAAIAIAYRILRELCGPSWKPQRVQFAYRIPRNTTPYTRVFRSPVRFEAEVSGITFASSYLQRTIAAADPVLHEMLATAMNEADNRGPTSFGDRVQRILHQMVLSGSSSADVVARIFGIHKRTLRRRLAEEGQNLHELVQRTRFELAQQLLENSKMPVTGIAVALRYEDPNAFSHAFRGWEKKGTVGAWTRGSLSWSHEGCEPHARMGYEANLIDPGAAWLRLTYTVDGTPMDYRVRLVNTRPNLWRLPLLVSLPPGARGRRTPAARCEALSSARWQIFRKPPSLWAHLHFMPGEREIRRALSTAGCRYGHGCSVYQVCSEAQIAIKKLPRRLSSAGGSDSLRVRVAWMATSAQSPLPSVRLTAHPERHRVHPVLLPHLRRLHPELRRIGHGVLETSARGTLGKFAQELTGADRRLQLILPSLHEAIHHLGLHLGGLQQLGLRRLDQALGPTDTASCNGECVENPFGISLRRCCGLIAPLGHGVECFFECLASLGIETDREICFC